LEESEHAAPTAVDPSLVLFVTRPSSRRDAPSAGLGSAVAVELDAERSESLGGGKWVSVLAGSLLAATLGSATACAGQAKPTPTVPADLPNPEPPNLQFMDHGFDDSVVRVVSPHVGCTGTLIAPDQVLTAHHCVAQRDEYGDYLMRDVDAAEVQVQLGGDYLPWDEVPVKAIVTPACGFAAGEGDIAILVLEHRVAGVRYKTVGLELTPTEGQQVEPVGFGRCADSEEGIRLRSREGGTIDRIAPSRFQLEAAICPGDSGGPGVTSLGVVVGIISASALDSRQSTRSRTEFTRVDHWPDVFANAQKISEGANPAELPPIAGCPER
jgi:hypothetical protein